MLKHLLLPFALLASSALHAQNADISVGGGINTLGSDFIHGSFVASASAHLGPYFSFGAEYAYQGVGGGLESTALYETNYISVTEKEHLQNFGGVWRAGFSHRHAAQSYLLLAGGGLHVTDTATVTTNYYSSPVSTAASATASANGAYFGVGGGVHIPIHGGFGIRPEFRYERQMLPSYEAAGFDFPASHANQILFTISLYRAFGRR